MPACPNQTLSFQELATDLRESRCASLFGKFLSPLIGRGSQLTRCKQCCHWLSRQMEHMQMLQASSVL